MYHDIFCCQGVVAEQSVSFSEALRMAPDPQLAVTPTPGAEEVWPLHKTAFSLFKPHVCVQYMYINIAANTVTLCAISAVFSVPQSHVINLWDYRHVCVCDIDTWSRWHFHAAEHTHVTWILRFCSVLIGRTLFTSHWIFIKSLVLLTHTDTVKTMTGAGSDRDAGFTQDLFHLLYPKHTSDFRHARDFFLKWLRVDECVCVFLQIVRSITVVYGGSSAHTRAFLWVHSRDEPVNGWIMSRARKQFCEKQFHNLHYTNPSRKTTRFTFLTVWCVHIMITWIHI